jgi:hypothetical protein
VGLTWHVVIYLDANVEISPAGFVMLVIRTDLAAAIARRPKLPKVLRLLDDLFQGVGQWS